MRAVVTGGTGFIGQQLIDRLEEPVVLTRNVAAARKKLPRAEVFAWDPLKGPPPAEAFAGVEAVFHLSGEPVASGRWTADKKRRIRESRKLGTENLVRGLSALGHRPKVLVSASAIGYYGSRGDDILDESASPGSDFLAQVCREWETASHGARALGMRVVNPRIGIVLDDSGGALAKMLTPFKFGMGGRLGSGRQWMSWIHVDDLVGMFLYAAQNQQIDGPMNGTAPNPVTNRDFTRILASTLHRPAFFPVPGPALQILLGEFGSILLDSQRAIPRAAQKAGYDFQFSDLSLALSAIVGT
jgi:uncharacterized protein (TIGR01777 family)